MDILFNIAIENSFLLTFIYAAEVLSVLDLFLE